MIALSVQLPKVPMKSCMPRMAKTSWKARHTWPGLELRLGVGPRLACGLGLGLRLGCGLGLEGEAHGEDVEHRGHRAYEG